MNHSPFDLDLEALEDLASERIVRRGLVYAHNGRVTTWAEDGDRLQGTVQGSRGEPYLVALDFDGEEILSDCSCPFDWEPLCKHAIAVLAARNDLGPDEALDERPRTKIAEEERKIRHRRGSRRGFRVAPVKVRGLLGRYRVHSDTGAAYLVEMRSISEAMNTCTCQDFLTNMLGTCKHIEAVRAALHKRSPRAWANELRTWRRRAQVYVDYMDTPRVRISQPERAGQALKDFARRFFDQGGVLLGDPAVEVERLQAAAQEIPHLVVHADVVDHAERVREERRVEARQAEVEALLAADQQAPGLQARLYPFQLKGAAFLASRGRALLADDMGLGKTIQAIAAACVLRARGELTRALIVCPASLKHQWASEIQRFTDMDVQIVGGPAAERQGQYEANASFTIVNYELVLRDQAFIHQAAPDLLILDEAQRIKNWRTKTAGAVKGLRSRFVFVLTGTPLENRLDDLYSLLQVVDPRVLGPLWSFNERFIVREEGKSRISGYKNLEELRRRFAPVLLRRGKDDVLLDLPSRTDTRLVIALTKRQRDHMEEATATAAQIASRAAKRPLTPQEEHRLFAAMQRARMACNASDLVDKEQATCPKLDEFEQIISELCVDHARKVVVFSEWERFQVMAAARADKLGVGYVRLHGGVPTPKRGALIDRFRDDPTCRVFFSTDAGGVGLNLQFASTLINLDLPWNPAVLEQRIGRIHRHGQAEPVHVVLAIAEDSFEARLERVLAGKRSLFQAAVTMGDAPDEIQAPSGCLRVMRDLIDEEEGADEGEAPRWIDEAAKDEDAMSGERPDAPPEDTGAPTTDAGDTDDVGEDPDDKPARLRQALGARLREILLLPSGRIVAIVDRADERSAQVAQREGVTILDAATADTMTSLGEDSPLGQARRLWRRAATPEGRPSPRRREQLTLAARKLRAARRLADDELGGEALVPISGALIAMARARAEDDASAALPPVRLLYEVLVPAEHLSPEQAALILRAEALASAYGQSADAPPDALLQAVLREATELHAQLARG
jgi:superfamily II DNA or RNA helicase